MCLGQRRDRRRLLPVILPNQNRPSPVALGVLVGGRWRCTSSRRVFILQLLPGASEGLAIILEHMVRDLPAISSLIDSGSTPEDIIEQAIGDLQPKISTGFHSVSPVHVPGSGVNQH